MAGFLCNPGLKPKPASKMAAYPRSHYGAEADFRHAHGLLTFISTPNSQNACMKWLELQTEDCLKARWQEVEAVANALLEKKSMAQKKYSRPFGMSHSIPVNVLVR